MLFGSEGRPLYEQALSAKRGKRRLPKPLEELTRWVSKTFAVNVLTVGYDHIDIGPCQGSPRLCLVVETAHDYAKLHSDRLSMQPDIKDAVLNHFSEVVAAHGLGDKYDTEGVHLICDDFSEEAIGKAAERFREKYGKRLAKEFATCGVWAIDGFAKETVVFYLRETDVRDNQRNGWSAKIRQRCYDLVKQYDEFGYLRLESFPIVFDSKENLDKNYAGSLFYYFR